MAQLAAVEQGLYYPTDQRVIRLFVEKHLRVSGFRYTIYDPCSGEGIALKTLAEALGERYLTTVGTEISEARAIDGQTRLKQSIHAAFEDCHFDGRPDLIWMNMPYDEVGGKRVELTWIDMVSPIVEQGKHMILVIPERFFKGHKNHDEMRLCLYRNNLELVTVYKNNYRDTVKLGGFRFPDPEYSHFKQHILVVKKTHRADLEKEIPVSGVIGEFEELIKIEAKSYGYNSDKDTNFNIFVNKRPHYESVLSEAVITEMFGAPENEVPITPLQPMIDEILAAVIAGGMFTGIRAGNKVVRGGIKVDVVKKTTEDPETGVKEEVETQRMTALVSELDMATGELNSYTSDQVEFGERIEAIAHAVREIMHKRAPSIYQEDMLKDYLPRFSDVRAPRAIAGHQNGLFPAQQRAVAMILRGWNNLKSVILLGKMGTGKTITSVAAAVAQIRNRKDDAQKIVILLPAKNDLVKKWKEEIAKSCRDIPHTIYDIETITEAQEAFATKGITFILVKESMLKRTSGWKHLSLRVLKNPKELDREHKLLDGHCFNCGSRVELRTSEDQLASKGGEILHCPECRVVYTTDVRDRNGNAYASLANYINKHYAKSYVLIADEAHQFKGGDTARGYASGNIIRGAWRVLCMTGTFYNGMASSMFFTLYRTQGSFRANNTHDGVKSFVELYGLEQTITRIKKRDKSLSWSGYNISKNTRVKEIPGIHPAMIAMMLPYTVFMKIEDFGTPKYSKKESTLFVDLQPSVADLIKKYLKDIKDDAIKQMKDGSMSLMSQLTWARAAIHDVYPLGDYVDGHKFAPVEPNKMTLKEEALLRYVQSVWKSGYPTLIYYLQTDRRPIDARVSRWFQEYGMKLAYMPSSVGSKVDFINEALKKGAHAILCNPNLVREGIDLLQFGGIFWYGVTPDAVLVDQANARIYRPLIQDHDVSIVYGGWNSTYQSEQWTNTAKKVAAMSAVHGDVRKGLAALLGEESLIATVQDHLIEFERQDSQLRLDDLPPLEVFEAKEPPIEEPVVIEVKADEWRPKDWDTSTEKVSQLSFF